MVQKLFVQLDSFLADDGTIPASLSSFSSNISNLANLSLTAVEQPLTLDYLLIQASEDEIPRYRESFFEKVWFELSAFSASFVSDYSVIGDFTQGSEQVTLWLTSGRDQSQVVKQLADNYFTRDTGVSVNVRLVTMDGILPAVASGKGPDVAIGRRKPCRCGTGCAARCWTSTSSRTHRKRSGPFPPARRHPSSWRISCTLYRTPRISC